MNGTGVHWLLGWWNTKTDSKVSLRSLLSLKKIFEKTIEIHVNYLPSRLFFSYSVLWPISLVILYFKSTLSLLPSSWQHLLSIHSHLVAEPHLQNQNHAWNVGRTCGFSESWQTMLSMAWHQCPHVGKMPVTSNNFWCQATRGVLGAAVSEKSTNQECEDKVLALTLLQTSMWPRIQHSGFLKLFCFLISLKWAWAFPDPGCYWQPSLGVQGGGGTWSETQQPELFLPD